MTPQIAFMLATLVGVIDRQMDLNKDTPEELREEIRQLKKQVAELFRQPQRHAPPQQQKVVQPNPPVARVANENRGGFA